MWIYKIGKTTAPKTTTEVLNMIEYALRANYTEEEAHEFWGAIPNNSNKWEGDDIREAAINEIMWDIITSLGEWYNQMGDPEQDLWYNLVHYCECDLPNCLNFLKTLKLDINNMADEENCDNKNYINGRYYYPY